MSDTPLPEDIGADHLAHLDSIIQTYKAQLETLKGLVVNAEKQFNNAKTRVATVASLLEVAEKAKADFIKGQADQSGSESK